MKITTTTNSDETIAFAKKFAESLSVPQIIVLSGDLGAGKTTFSKGIAQGLGIQEIVTSPTFTILNEYQNTTPLYHFDMYRLSSVDEAYNLGFETYFDLRKLDGIVLVEWAENVEGLIKSPYIKITLEKIDENKRKIIIEEK